MSTRQLPPLTFPIRVPSDVLEALGEFTGHSWSDSLKLEPFICDAIRDYIKSAPEPASAAQQQPAPPSDAGYQWKEVFLPEGTRLRASFGHKAYFAVVDGSEIKYGEHPISPSCFANLHGSGNRNAWKAIWMRLPGSDGWLLADVCRSARKAAIARLVRGDSHGASEPSLATPKQTQDKDKPQRGEAHSRKSVKNQE